MQKRITAALCVTVLTACTSHYGNYAHISDAYNETMADDTADELGGFILHDKGDLWTKAANYHSYTPEYNSLYRAKLKAAARRWAEWLGQHFKTRVANNK